MAGAVDSAARAGTHSSNLMWAQVGESCAAANSTMLLTKTKIA